jgi:hypothetical protein
VTSLITAPTSDPHRQPASEARHFPDYPAPIVRNGAQRHELARARWGMPSSQRGLIDATKKLHREAKRDGRAKTAPQITPRSVWLAEL